MWREEKVALVKLAHERGRKRVAIGQPAASKLSGPVPQPSKWTLARG